MKVIYTDESLEGLEESLSFFRKKVEIPEHKLSELLTKLFDRADDLVNHPFSNQKEEKLAYLNKGHRRAVEGEFKVVYYVDGDIIYVTDFFYTHMNPNNIRG